MMNINNFKKKCTAGFAWNACMYGIEKSAYWIISLMLFAKLSAHHFSLWANINSIVYLMLLWSDIGFRKSLPRYLPLYAHTNHLFKNFFCFILNGQLLALAAMASVFYLVIPLIFSALHLPYDNIALTLALLLFAAEGAVAFVKTIFHAHFWHRQFNLTSSTMALIEIPLNSSLIYFLPPSITLVKALILSRTITATAVCLINLTYMQHLSKKMNLSDEHQNINITPKKSEFIIHSAHMWGGITLKSLSERNFMLPLLTFFFGPELANIYKIVNGGVLLIQRAITKTIGTIDTSILSHVSINHESRPHLIFNEINKLITTYSRLIIPLGISISIAVPFCNHSFFITNAYALPLFMIISITYLSEIILSPYERYMEVTSQYKKMWVSYIPYTTTLFLALTLIATHHYNITLILFLTLIHMGRLISALTSWYIVRQLQHAACSTISASPITQSINPLPPHTQKSNETR